MKDDTVGERAFSRVPGVAALMVLTSWYKLNARNVESVWSRAVRPQPTRLLLSDVYEELSCEVGDTRVPSGVDESVTFVKFYIRIDRKGYDLTVHCDWMTHHMMSLQGPLWEL